MLQTGGDNVAKRHGHYCKVCGEMKSNESFSGKGHNAHICKKCASLSPAKQAENATLNKLYNLPFHLSQQQKEWLKKLQHDKRPEIAAAAQEIYAERYPNSARAQIKKNLHIRHMELTINGEFYDGFGDFDDRQIIFILDRSSGSLFLKEDGSTSQADLTAKQQKKLLNRIVNNYDIYWWNEDYGHPVMDPDIDYNLLFDGEMTADEFDTIDELILSETSDTEIEPAEDPIWKVHVEYSNGETQDMCGSGDYLPDQINELVLELLSYFDSDEEDEWY